VKVFLRVVLTVLLVFVAVKVGVMFAPRLARLGAGSGATPGMLSAGGSGAAQPDWGGGRLSFSGHSAAGVVDSVKSATPGDPLRTQTFSGRAAGVVLRQKSGTDYALTMAMPSPRQPGRTAMFEVPSSGHFRKELLPGDGDAEAPAADIPLYPQSRCRMQVGRGTACFVGFYLTPDGVEAVRSFYVQALSKLGWQRVVAGRPGFLETFTKRSEDRAVVLQLRKQDSTTTRIGLVATCCPTGAAAATSGSPDRSERK
jgi:hypothetical protein